MIPFRTPPGYDPIQAETFCRRLSSHAQEGFAATLESVPCWDCPQCEAQKGLDAWERDGPYATGERHAYVFLLGHPHECGSDSEGATEDGGKEK